MKCEDFFVELAVVSKMAKAEHNIIIIQKNDFPYICRCCLSKNPTYRIFKLELENVPFSQIMQYLFNTRIKKHDGLPEHICSECIANVATFFKFKRTFDAAELILSSINEQSEVKNTVKSESQFYKSVIDINQENTSQDIVEDHKENFTEEWHNVAPGSDNKELKLETTQEGPVKNTILSSNTAANIVSDNKELETATKESSEKDTMQSSNTVPNIVCSCQETFTTISEYLSHKKGQIKKKKHVRLWHCQLCDKYFRPERFVVHQRSHTNERPYQCKLCPKNFSDYANLQRHNKTHTGVKPYVCEICGKAFNRSTNLATHGLVHTKEKPFLCSICGKRFIQKSSLNIHLATHSSGTKASASREKKVLCSYCGKKILPANLKVHSYTHTDERPFACRFCDKKFRTTSTLKDHCRVHTGERPFACKFCGRKFNATSSLRSHCLLHSGEKPFACFICEKRFLHRHKLRAHLRTHQEEGP